MTTHHDSVTPVSQSGERQGDQRRSPSDRERKEQKTKERSSDIVLGRLAHKRENLHCHTVLKCSSNAVNTSEFDYLIVLLGLQYGTDRRT
jgi:hypothetical protein